MNNFREVRKYNLLYRISDIASSKVSAFSHFICIFVCILFLGFPLKAQLVGFPTGPVQSKTLPSKARVQAVELPFFDDFSLVINGSLDPSLWKAGGTYVNNTATINHPTLNVVTFDGAGANGKPYNFTNQNASGPGDTLTSAAIDLSNLSPKDSIFLSFYWQLKGLNELPDANDSLIVQFLDNTSQWRTVWTKTGGTPDNNFNFANLAIRNTVFFHTKFQFRFQAFARLSGQFDAWHIDYVYLNKGRNSSDRFIADVACRLPVSSFLKRYTSMPLKQYIANPAAETADSISTDITNLFNFPNSISFSYTLKEENSGQIFQNFQETSPNPLPGASSQPKRLKLTPLSILDATKPFTLVSKFLMATSYSLIGNINLKRNDTISGKTILNNYYAYDDGTAESAVYMNQPLQRAAVRYFLNKPDTISAVRVNVVPTLKDLTGQPITIQVWDNRNGAPQRLLYQQSFKVEYSALHNGFVEFNFDFGVAVKDTFYVGWLQIGQDGVPIGLDRNHSHEDQIFVNLSREWVPYTSFANDPNLAYFRGSLMIRPVMGNKPLPPPITSVPEQNPLDWDVYPNPTSGLIRWKTNEIQSISVYNISGTLLKQQSFHASEQSMDLSNLPTGVYLLQLSNQHKTVVKKILLQR